MKNKLYIVGAGPGSHQQLTLAAAEVLREADCIVAAERHLPLAPADKKIIKLGNFEETFTKIDEQLRLGTVAVLVSGDTGIFSLAPLLAKRFGAAAESRILPGICALQYLCAAVGEKWDDAAVISVHGRDAGAARILGAVEANRRAAFFCGPEFAPQKLCRLLTDGGLGRVTVTVGERLSYDDQKITTGPASELAENVFDPLSVVFVVNDAPWRPMNVLPRDEDFLRTEVPMTRECVRAAAIGMLALAPDAVLWDIGAGSGSVSVAAAMQCPDGTVFAIERSSEAAALIGQNLRKFRLHNVEIVPGDALAVVPSLPRPTHIFIGGSGDELPALINYAAGFGGVRIVAAAVTLRTYALASELLCGDRFDCFEAQQIAVSRSKKVGASVIMSAQNPVTLFAAVTKEIGEKGAVGR